MGSKSRIDVKLGPRFRSSTTTTATTIIRSSSSSGGSTHTQITCHHANSNNNNTQRTFCYYAADFSTTTIPAPPPTMPLSITQTHRLVVQYKRDLPIVSVNKASHDEKLAPESKRFGIPKVMLRFHRDVLRKSQDDVDELC
ncbi:hypothetical protein M0802_005442 [Mischocyttarus mexicanus]|nr:hypothetical protein M0802_005442 [Mischocyttarus mexicanus]